MTKLTDVLRGAADRAPLGDATVAVDATARRVARRRGMRAAANGAVGLGAVGLLAVGIVAPGMVTNDQAQSAPQWEADGGAEFPRNELSNDESAFAAPYGVCGTEPWLPDATEDAPQIEVYVDGNPAADVEHEQGEWFSIQVTADAEADRFSLTRILLVHDGVVVRDSFFDTYSNNAVDGGVSGDMYPGNCWDGFDLPPGEYQLLVAQEFFAEGFGEGPVEPEPLPEPTATTGDGPGVAEGSGEDSSAGAPPLDVMLEANPIQVAVADPITFTIMGEPVEDPFDMYLNPVAPDTPEGQLSPDLARELFEAGLTSQPWDMAAGTSRWVMTSYDSYEEDDWSANYYGCAWDGTRSVFPIRNAELDLLDITVQRPGSVNLSHGWVVDGNPEVSMSLTNTSEYTIPGLYGAGGSLFLAQDGNVVGEVYLTSINQYSDYEMQNPSATSAELMAMSQGLVAPGATLEDTLLWRDLNGCWTERGPNNVPAGTYTLLVQTYMHVSAGAESWAYDFDYSEDSVSEGMDTPTTDIAPTPMADIARAPEYYDWVELQMWTSLGSVTVTTN